MRPRSTARSPHLRRARQLAKVRAVSEREEAEAERDDFWLRIAAMWLAHREQMWAPTRVVSEWLVDRLDPQAGQTILDLAAGTGETGFLVAERLGERGRLISSDSSPHMVEAARSVAGELGVRNVDFRVLDATRLDLEDASVDGVVCRWGYMLMDDPLEALRETRRVLRRRGRLVFSTWAAAEHNPWMTLSGRVMVERGLLEPRDPGGPSIFYLGDRSRIRGFVKNAGFSRPEIEDVALRYRFADRDDFWRFVSELQGPIALAIQELGDDERAAVRGAVEERIGPFETDAGIGLPGLALNVATD